ncbi:TPA: hypothetical protein JG809_005208 [Vibrio parahaemolyticus]|uniref:hypothetical protein n=1 Tax=Vibrio parahaemolyticus TaxID=670 RepID=UPI000318CFF6|nr:hypothetical protein [Vibrio parahaemolyticus]EJA7340271.1 hypothetical protein [Vibrio parahaemolyticus]MBE4069691.1 hypothetical protein [Vibrio parahaemolyticus]MBY3746907.1 hypothetical protein [Vibrio parahaemolyticus]MBY3759070.1 hypothetical protein [Vibrio parahaemolyticus]MBY3767274.1 hypothetical protein [Vibrio parahaemolyticus]
MAVQRKHSDLPPRYEASDLTNEQRHRFTEVANAAHKRRKFYKQAIEKSLVGKMKERAFKPMIAPQQGKPSRARQAFWLIVFLALGLWAMHFFA